MSRFLVTVIMTNIGLIGDVNAGCVDLLRMIVRYIEQGGSEKIEPDLKYDMVKMYIPQELTTHPDKTERIFDSPEGKTIYPSRVVVRETRSGKNHTIFSYEREKDSIEVKRVVETICRVSFQIIFIISLDRDLESQLAFFSDIRLFPGEFYVCLNNVDLIQEEVPKAVEESIEKIHTFFIKRNRKILGYIMVFPDVSEENSYKKQYNDLFMAILLSNVSERRLSLNLEHYSPLKDLSFKEEPLKSDNLDWQRSFIDTKTLSSRSEQQNAGQYVEERVEAYTTEISGVKQRLLREIKSESSSKNLGDLGKRFFQNIKRRYRSHLRRKKLDGTKYAPVKSSRAKQNQIEVIRKAVLDMGTKFSRIYISEISEVCSVRNKKLIIATVKKMLQNGEFEGYYFNSTKSVVFNLQEKTMP